MNKFVLVPNAQKELYEATYWYELKSDDLGIRFYRNVYNIIDKILLNPQTYGYINKQYRQAGVTGFPYVIVYRFNQQKKMVTVVSVFHTSRNKNY